MSVRGRVVRLESGSAPLDSVSEDVLPTLPPRPKSSEPADLPRSVTLSSPSGSLTPRVDSGRPARPPVPPKSKAISERLAVSFKQARSLDEVELLDLSNETQSNGGSFKLLEPAPSILEETGEDPSVVYKLENAGNGMEERPPLPSRTPRILQDAAQNFTKLRLGAPVALRSASEGAQATFKTVRSGGAKAFQDLASSTDNALVGTQAFVAGLQTGIERTIKGIPIPTVFAQTAEDLADLAKLPLGRPGICSRCSSLQLERCFQRKDDTADEAFELWSTPLSRIVLHSSWCLLCKLLLSLLCRDEHDPLQLPDVRDHIEPVWLRGLPLRDWVSRGYIHSPDFWPFGRGEYRYETSRRLVEPIADMILSAKRFSYLSQERQLLKAAGAKRSERLNRSRVLDRRAHKDQAYREAYEEGYKEARLAARSKISAVVIITLSTSRAERPGLLWVDLMGCSNAPRAEERVLSHFMLQAVSDRSTVSYGPEKPLSYGFVLDPQWIETVLAKLWLAECETQHGRACSEHGWDVAMEKPHFLRVVDVIDLRVVVVDSPASCRYVALSYVWGAAEMLKLRHTNAQALAEEGGLAYHLKRIPRTILDAMEVVKSVGERYLWCDSLCILRTYSHTGRKSALTGLVLQKKTQVNPEIKSQRWIRSTGVHYSRSWQAQVKTPMMVCPEFVACTSQGRVLTPYLEPPLN